MNPKSVSVSAALSWYSCGWQLFRKAPAMWLVMIIMLAAIGLVLMLIPLHVFLIVYWGLGRSMPDASAMPRAELDGAQR